MFGLADGVAGRYSFQIFCMENLWIQWVMAVLSGFRCECCGQKQKAARTQLRLSNLVNQSQQIESNHHVPIFASVYAGLRHLGLDKAFGHDERLSLSAVSAFRLERCDGGAWAAEEAVVAEALAVGIDLRDRKRKRLKELLGGAESGAMVCVAAGLVEAMNLGTALDG